MMQFDVEGFVCSLGKRADIARFCRVSRTAPYGWIRRGNLNSVLMARLVEYSRKKKIALDMNKFFVEKVRRNGKGIK